MRKNLTHQNFWDDILVFYKVMNLMSDFYSLETCESFRHEGS